MEKSCVTSSCVTPAGASTSLTSRINGMTTHTHTHSILQLMYPFFKEKSLLLYKNPFFAVGLNNLPCDWRLLLWSQGFFSSPLKLTRLLRKRRQHLLRRTRALGKPSKMFQDWNTVIISKTRPIATRGQRNAATAAAQRTESVTAECVGCLGTVLYCSVL